MNKTNQALMGTAVGIAAAYALLSFIFTLMNFNDGDFTVNFDPFGIVDGSIIPDALHDAYWSLIDLYTSLVPDYTEYMTMALFTIGFVFVLAGCASKPTRNFKGPDSDPQEYLFTHRPKAFLWCVMIPWNILTAAWRLKKIPVIVPIIFIPFMLPFAVLMDIFLIVIFAIMWLIMTARIRSASSKDTKMYDTNTQYAVCPKCKRNFYQPRIKCRCGLTISYPVPDAHGVSYHTCNRGHKIPSTNADGARGKLAAVCPHCDKDIVTHEAKPLVLSLVGSVGSGKTTLMLSGVEAVCATAKERSIVTEIVSDGISVEAQRAKGHTTPTPPGELDSQCMFIRSRDLNEKEIVINDISGLEFEPDSDKVLFEEYYKYNDGIIFTIDPLAVMAIHNSQSPTKGSKTTPVVTLESFYHMFTEVNGYGPSVKSTVPIAVVLTGMDKPAVRSAVDNEGSPEKFLKRYGQESFVKILGSAFQNIRYFAIASLGEKPNAIEPFKWILAENDDDIRKKLF